VRTVPDGSLPGQPEPEPPINSTATDSDDHRCRTCGRPQPEWVLASREGDCISCHRKEPNHSKPAPQREATS
jgi:hypothetical protein